DVGEPLDGIANDHAHTSLYESRLLGVADEALPKLARSRPHGSFSQDLSRTRRWTTYLKEPVEVHDPLELLGAPAKLAVAVQPAVRALHGPITHDRFCLTRHVCLSLR